MNFLLLLFSLANAATNLQWNGNNNIGRQLPRSKRDLIGWNRARNTVYQYGRHKTVEDDFMPYIKQYKKFMMKLNPENREEFRKALKAIKQRQNSQ